MATGYAVLGRQFIAHFLPNFPEPSAQHAVRANKRQTQRIPCARD